MGGRMKKKLENVEGAICRGKGVNCRREARRDTLEFPLRLPIKGMERTATKKGKRFRNQAHTA